MRIVTLVLLISLTASAQEYKDAADEAEVQFTLGNQAYLRRDFRQAIAHWFASTRLAPNRNVVFNIGRAYEQLAQYVEAYRYYQTFSQYELSEGERAAVAASLKRVSTSVALLDVTTTPPGATLYVDRKDLGGHGTTPRVLALSPGAHTILLELEGHEPFVRSDVNLVVGERTVVHAAPRRLTGRLVLRGRPAGATVRLEGPGGVTAATLPATVELGPGRYKAIATLEGYAPRELYADIVAQEEAALDVTLVRLTGTLVVQADERDALVLVDGQPAGFTPAVVDAVPSGRHDVSVVLEGFRTWTGPVDVAPDEKTLVTAELLVSEDVAAASRTTESAESAPASVSLIPERELEAFGAQTLADAVRGERGIYSSDDGTYKSIGVRGFSPFGQYGNRLAVQIDGHSMNDDWIGSSFVGFDLLSDLAAVERIELVRGPGSVLYGTGAFFGVVNIVTHATAPRRLARLGLASDSEGVIRGSAGAGVALGDDAGVWVSGGGLFGQAGDFTSKVRAEAGETSVAKDVGGFESGSVIGRAWWRDLTLQWYFNQRNKGITNGAFDTVFGDDRAHSDDRRAFIELRYEPVLASWVQLFTRLSYDHSFYRGVFPYPDDESGVLRESYTGNWGDAEARAVFRPIDGLRVTTGADVQLHLGNDAEGAADNGGAYLAESHPFRVLSAYAIADYAPARWVSASAGVRFDGWWIDGLRHGGVVDDLFLSSANPRLALVFHPTADGTLKLLAGRAFRAPSIYEHTYWDGGLTQIQSPDLDPEVVYTGEIEYSHRLPLGFTVTAGAFLNSIAGLIEQRGSGEGDPLHFVNLDRDVWTAGAELEIARELRRGWMASVQYSFQRTRLGSLDAGKDDEPANSPAHLAALKLIVPIARPELMLATRLAVESGRLDRNRERTDAAVLWDAVLSGTIAPAHLRYAVGVRNLTDWQYSEPVGEDIRDAVLAQPGRTFFADLELSW